MQEEITFFEVMILLHSGGILGPYAFTKMQLAALENAWIGVEPVAPDANFRHRDGWLVLDLQAVVGFDKRDIDDE